MNNLTRKSAWWPVLLVGGHLLAGAVLAGFIRFVVYGSSRGHEASLVALLGLVVGQAGLLALWAVFSRRRRSVRSYGAVGGALLVSGQMLAVVDDWGHARDFIGIAIWVGAPMLVVSICALLLRRRGVEVVGADELVPNAMREGVQFSIGQILWLTSLIALLLAVTRVLRGLGHVETVVSTVLVAALIGILFGGQTLVALWAALGLGRPWWRLAFPLMLAAASAALIHLSTDDNAGRHWVYIGTTEWQTAVVLISLLAVRRAGYRMVRGSQRAEQRG